MFIKKVKKNYYARQTFIRLVYFCIHRIHAQFLGLGSIKQCLLVYNLLCSPLQHYQ